jgi:starch synthase (maltosyl-transferring)
MSDRKIRIAHLITDLDVGGAEKNLATVATGLDRGRFEVFVASLLAPGRIGKDLAAAGIPVADIHMTSAADLRAFGRLVEWLRKTRPDILHTWLFHANLLGRAASVAARVPAVVSSILVAEPRRWHLLMERLTSPLADRIVPNSPGLHDYMMRHGVSPERMTVIPNGIDVERFAGPRREAHGRPRTVLFVGRLTEQKGVDVLLRAARELVTKCRLQLVGDGPDREKLRALAAELGLADVRFLGRSDNVPELLARADVFVLPSRWEGMPTVVLEAMAARCPVVGTDVIGTRDLIRHGENGLLAPCDDPHSLAEAIDRIAGDETLAAALVANGYKTALEHAASVMLEAHERMYLELMEKRSSHRAHAGRTKRVTSSASN